MKAARDVACRAMQACIEPQIGGHSSTCDRATALIESERAAAERRGEERERAACEKLARETYRYSRADAEVCDDIADAIASRALGS